jgi:predicted sulfurtransferase
MLTSLFEIVKFNIKIAAYIDSRVNMPHAEEKMDCLQRDRTYRCTGGIRCEYSPEIRFP